MRHCVWLMDEVWSWVSETSLLGSLTRNYWGEAQNPHGEIWLQGYFLHFHQKTQTSWPHEDVENSLTSWPFFPKMATSCQDPFSELPAPCWLGSSWLYWLLSPSINLLLRHGLLGVSILTEKTLCKFQAAYIFLFIFLDSVYSRPLIITVAGKCSSGQESESISGI